MKKYFKKLTAILVVLVMLLASVPASAQTTSTAQKRSVYSQVNVQKGYILGSYNLNKNHTVQETWYCKIYQTFRWLHLVLFLSC